MTKKTLSRRQFTGQVMLSAAGLALLSCSRYSKWQIGCFTRPWAEFDYHVAFDSIAEAGFEYVGLMSSKDGAILTSESTTDQAVKVKEEASSRGLKIASMWGGEFGAEKSVEQGVAGLKKVIDNSAAAGCGYIVLGGTWDPAVTESYYKAVSECCDYAAEKMVMLTIKPHGPFNATGSECRELIEKINHKSFSLWYDPGNIYYYSDGNLSPVNDAATVNGLVSGMSVKDFRMPKDVDVTPGTGMVDFRAVMEKLEDGGFTRGPLIVECLAKGDLNFINSEAKKTVAYLEELLG